MGVRVAMEIREPGREYMGVKCTGVISLTYIKHGLQRFFYYYYYYYYLKIVVKFVIKTTSGIIPDIWC